MRIYRVAQLASRWMSTTRRASSTATTVASRTACGEPAKPSVLGSAGV
ncbi:hypothetical protein [Rhodococcus spongiicola]|nr:hypothetical protein [Rhodococcus spongiicola]